MYENLKAAYSVHYFVLLLLSNSDLLVRLSMPGLLVPGLQRLIQTSLEILAVETIEDKLVRYSNPKFQFTFCPIS